MAIKPILAALLFLVVSVQAVTNITTIRISQIPTTNSTTATAAWLIINAPIGTNTTNDTFIIKVSDLLKLQTPTITDGTNTSVIQLGPFTIGKYPIATGTNKLGDGALYKVNTNDVGFDGTLYLGPGVTNYVVRSGVNILLQSSSSPAVILTNTTTANRAELVANNDGSGRLYAPDGYVAVQNSSAMVRLNSTYFEPSSSGSVNLGGPVGNWWGDVGGTTHYANGYQSGTNHSWLAIYHTGTNGAVVFDSIATGSAGIPRQFNFAMGGSTILTINTNGASQTYVQANDGTGYYLTLNGLVPLSDNSVSLGGGSFSSWWHDLGLKGSAYIMGYVSGTNSVRTVISHTGTNGVVQFDSQATGTNVARPFAFNINTTTNTVQFDADTTAGETRMLLWDVSKGTLSRVSVGANDSGGAGFKVLRVPN